MQDADLPSEVDWKDLLIAKGEWIEFTEDGIRVGPYRKFMEGGIEG
jgi:hypothetical protein